MEPDDYLESLWNSLFYEISSYSFWFCFNINKQIQTIKLKAIIF